MSVENRAYPRHALEVDAEVHYGDKVIPVRTRDVSRGGMCFIAETGVPAGAEVRVNMALVFDEATFSEPLKLRARIVWCTAFGDSYQIGSTFLGLTSDSRAYLDMFLRYLEESAEDDEDDDKAKAKGGGPFDS